MRAAPWRDRAKSDCEHGEERVDSTVKESRVKEGEEGQAKRTSLREVGKTIRDDWMQKLSRGIGRVLVSLQFWPNLK